MWQQIENMGFLNYVFSFSCWNISLEKISGLMIMEKKELYIFVIKCFMIHTYTLIKFFFLFFLAKVKHMLLRKVFHWHSSGSCLVYLSTKQNVKGLYFYKSNYISKQLVIIYHVALYWTKMLFSAWLLEVMICIHKSVKYSNMYLLFCLIAENNTPCWNTWRFGLNDLTCQFSDIYIHLLTQNTAYTHANTKYLF